MGKVVTIVSLAIVLIGFVSFFAWDVYHEYQCDTACVEDGHTKGHSDIVSNTDNASLIFVGQACECFDAAGAPSDL